MKEHKFWYHSLYNTKKWSLVREAHLLRQSNCTYCNSTFTLQVDHIFDHKGDYNLFIRQDNLQTLCVDHHTMKGTLDKYSTTLENKDWTLTLDFLTSSLTLEDYFILTKNYLKALEKYFNEQEVKLTDITLHVRELSLGDLKHLVNLSLKKMKSKPSRLIFKGTVPRWIQDVLHSYLKTPKG